MVNAPPNSNSITVPTVETGYLQITFDSGYPVRLNSIISQDEYQQSIANINRIFTSGTSLIRLSMIICGLCVIIGFMITKVGRVISPDEPLILIGIGFGVVVIGAISLVVGIYVTGTKRLTRLKETIAEESAKYSRRSPTSCSWRLDINRVQENVNRIQNGPHLIIDIHQNAAVYLNMNPFQSISNLPQPDVTLPLLYPGTAEGLCSQCNMPSRNLKATLCQSCLTQSRA